MFVQTSMLAHHFVSMRRATGATGAGVRGRGRVGDAIGVTIKFGEEGDMAQLYGDGRNGWH